LSPRAGGPAWRWPTPTRALLLRCSFANQADGNVFNSAGVSRSHLCSAGWAPSIDRILGHSSLRCCARRSASFGGVQGSQTSCDIAGFRFASQRPDLIRRGLHPCCFHPGFPYREAMRPPSGEGQAVPAEESRSPIAAAGSATSIVLHARRLPHDVINQVRHSMLTLCFPRDKAAFL
jgi:hypothetical protein